MNQSDIISKTETHVRELFKAHPNDIFAYHNLEHTEKVVDAVNQIADHYQLDESEIQAIHIAAWFHDVGYLFVLCDGHEEKSTELAITFLEDQGAGRNLIENVRETILATKIFTKPNSLIAKILADADLFHLGTPEFRKTNKKMWVEMKRCFGEKIPSDEWQKGALKLLEEHQFHTEYCRNLLQEGKQENINFLREWFEKNDIRMQTGE